MMIINNNNNNRGKTKILNGIHICNPWRDFHFSAAAAAVSFPNNINLIMMITFWPKNLIMIPDYYYYCYYVVFFFCHFQESYSVCFSFIHKSYLVI